MPKSVGRPTKLTKAIQDELVKTLRSGNYLETAASFAGLSHSIIREWVRRGERESIRLTNDPEAKPIKSEIPFMEFSVAIKKAQAQSEVMDVMLIGNAARESWQAAAWRLERKFPDRWGRKDKHEVSGPNGGPVQVEEIREKLIQKFNSIDIIPSSTETKGE